jgi:hypothetical protein
MPIYKIDTHYLFKVIFYFFLAGSLFINLYYRRGEGKSLKLYFGLLGGTVIIALILTGYLKLGTIPTSLETYGLSILLLLIFCYDLFIRNKFFIKYRTIILIVLSVIVAGYAFTSIVLHNKRNMVYAFICSLFFLGLFFVKPKAINNEEEEVPVQQDQ